jgi:hypothetical protein
MIYSLFTEDQKMVRKVQSPSPFVTALPSSARAAVLARIIDDAFGRYSGALEELERAIGLLMLGDQLGWKVLVLVHNKRTIRKYEEILGINVRDFFPAEGPSAMRSTGYGEAQERGSFWKAVSGDVPIMNRRDISPRS